MRTILYSLLISGACLSQSYATQVETPTKSPGQVLEGSKNSWVTDALDMQGGGVTLVEMLADKVIDRIEQRWNMQGQVQSAFKAALKDPFFRSVADELSRQSPETFVTAWNLIDAHMQNPVVLNAFQNYGVLSGLTELALSIEKSKLGYFEHVYDGPVNVRGAVLKLWRAATSPAEERLRYSAAYRYGVD